MIWSQSALQLLARGQGLHLVTEEIISQLPDLERIHIGVAHLFLQHTSAALALNENAEPEVRADLITFLDRLAPESDTAYTHNYEGLDDMPAHIKSFIVGASLTIPLRNGQLALGTWQGVYLCEYRRHAAARNLLVTLWGTDGESVEDSSHHG